MKVLSTYQVGEDPDVLAYDPGLKRLYVSAESGTVTVFQSNGKSLSFARFLRDASRTYGIGRSKDPPRLLPAGEYRRPSSTENYAAHQERGEEFHPCQKALPQEHGQVIASEGCNMKTRKILIIVALALLLVGYSARVY